MNTSRFEPDFVRIVYAIAHGKMPNPADRETLIAGLKLAICELDYMNAYWQVVRRLPRSDETIDEDHLRDAAAFGLERLNPDELVQLVRDRFELLGFRDNVFERLRDPEVPLDENDYWLKALWESSQSAVHGQGDIGDDAQVYTALTRLKIGPPPVEADEKPLAAAPDSASGVSFLAAITINGVHCDFWEKDGDVYLSPVQAGTPRSIQLDSEYRAVRDEESGCFRICGLKADKLLKVSADLNAIRNSHECRIIFE